MVAPTVLTLSQANSKIAACPSLSVLPAETVKGPAVLEYRVIALRSFTPHREVDASRAQTWMKKMRYTRHEYNANDSSTEARHSDEAQYSLYTLAGNLDICQLVFLQMSDLNWTSANCLPVSRSLEFFESFFQLNPLCPRRLGAFKFLDTRFAPCLSQKMIT